MDGTGGNGMSDRAQRAKKGRWVSVEEATWAKVTHWLDDTHASSQTIGREQDAKPEFGGCTVLNSQRGS